MQVGWMGQFIGTLLVVFGIQNFMASNGIHNVQQTLVTIYIVIHHVAGGHFIKKLLCTGDFCLFDWSEFETFHRSFGLGHKEDKTIVPMELVIAP